VVNQPPDLQPAFAAFLCLVLAGLLAAGSMAVLRILAVCRHHMERLLEIEAMESQVLEQIAEHQGPQA
jgi:hypothetical protein